MQIGNRLFYTNFAVLKIEIKRVIFKCYLHENKVLHTPTFYMKTNHFDIVFHITWKEWQHDKNIRSSEIKNKFQREQRTTIVFQKLKRIAQAPNFQEN